MSFNVSRFSGYPGLTQRGPVQYNRANAYAKANPRFGFCCVGGAALGCLATLKFTCLGTCLAAVLGPILAVFGIKNAFGKKGQNDQTVSAPPSPALPSS